MRRSGRSGASLIGLGLVVAVLATTVAVAGAQSDTDEFDDLVELFPGVERGLSWPDGDYRVMLHTAAEQAGVFDGTVGAGVGFGGGSFTVPIEGGQTTFDPPSRYNMRWLVFGTGAAPGFGTGSAEIDTFERGFVRVDDGVVTLIGETATTTVTSSLLPIPMAIPEQVLEDYAIPLVATSARCGFVEGYFLGKFEALAFAAQMFGVVSGWTQSSFVATGGPLRDVDFDGFREELEFILEDIYGLAPRISGDDAANREIAGELHDMITRAEQLIATLSATGCGAPGDDAFEYGIGLLAAVARVVAQALQPWPNLTVGTLWSFVSAGTRVGAIGPTGADTLNFRTLDRLSYVDSRAGDDPDALLTMAMIAAAAGDTALANEYVGRAS